MAGKSKAPSVRKVVNEAVEILQAFGVPLSAATSRRREMAGMCFLAVAGVTHSADWASAGRQHSAPLGTRQIIDFINAHFEEKISRGSYDDIRRKHLREAVLAGLVVNSAANPNAAANDPTRGYSISAAHATLIRTFGHAQWAVDVAKFMSERPAALVVASGRQAVESVAVMLPNGTELRLGPGQHNALQRSIVEQFRPRFAAESRVLYLGDAENRTVVCDRESLLSIGLPLETSGSLPDVILWDERRGWVFLIEAVHSFGPISPARLISLETLCASCSQGLVFVTAFLDRGSFRKFAPEIAWETEVWIAEEPDHMIHFNGDRFMGPRAGKPHQG